jgi:hypothetical protein
MALQLIVKLEALLQLARLAERLFEDAPLDLVQFVRADQLSPARPCSCSKCWWRKRSSWMKLKPSTRGATSSAETFITAPVA